VGFDLDPDRAGELLRRLEEAEKGAALAIGLLWDTASVMARFEDTGPVTQNMRLALHKTYKAVPSPKIVIAVGACAISGGPYLGHPQARDGASGTVPLDLYIPVCPPHPLTILDGLLRLLGRLKEEGRL